MNTANGSTRAGLRRIAGSPGVWLFITASIAIVIVGRFAFS